MEVTKHVVVHAGQQPVRVLDRQRQEVHRRLVEPVFHAARLRDSGRLDVFSGPASLAGAAVRSQRAAGAGTDGRSRNL